MEHISSNQKMDWLQRFQTRVQSREPGGSIANSLHAAASQGSSCTFSCSMGEDLEKDLFLQGFNKNLFKQAFNIQLILLEYVLFLSLLMVNEPWLLIYRPMRI